VDIILSKKPANIILLLFAVLLIISLTLHKSKVNIVQLLSTFIIEKIGEIQKQELINDREKIEFKHLSIYYTDVDEKLLPATKSSVNRAIELNEHLFGSNYTKPYDLIIFNSKFEIESFSGLEYSIGVNSPQLNMFGILPENKEGLIEGIPPLIWKYKSNIIHEYTHYVFSQKLTELGLTGQDIPLWFSEGIAVYVGNDDMDISILESKILPLNQLSTYKQWNNYRIDPLYDVYLQSYLAVRFLINRHGDDIINQILIQTQITDDFEEGFRRATGFEIDHFVYYE
jgi:hypothetical protein